MYEKPFQTEQGASDYYLFLNTKERINTGTYSERCRKITKGQV